MTRPRTFMFAGKTGNKFGAIRTTCGQGHVHDSKHEATVCNDLYVRQLAGEISHFEIQPKFPITINGEPLRIRGKTQKNGRPVVYTADFAFHDHAEKPPRKRVLDAKGIDPPRSRLLRALAEHIYRVQVELV